MKLLNYTPRGEFTSAMGRAQGSTKIEGVIGRGVLFYYNGEVATPPT